MLHASDSFTNSPVISDCSVGTAGITVKIWGFGVKKKINALLCFPYKSGLARALKRARLGKFAHGEIMNESTSQKFRS
jgi:hypothetical protein